MGMEKWGSLSFFGELSLCGKEGQGHKGEGRRQMTARKRRGWA
uniref:Uncharacterized protein n=1 Tax=Setaria italica TaxID=4555 RepID=K3XUI9_SETIT